ncbi:MAG: protein TolQ [Burkholderiales bacterium]|nr:protein TolQ [Burkholderiales bacterium]
MEITKDLSFLGMITNASVVVQVILALLLLVSLLSWWHIFMKMFSIRRAVKQAEKFERDFWSSPDLNAIFQSATSGKASSGSLEKIFEAGFREFLKLKRQPGMDNGAVMEGTRRAMRATYQREMDGLESNLPFLATVGSVSPYVGLFGTVWGIMNAFRGLANVAQATLAHVAPGIAEALIATAIGLFAAIPAVVAYNRYSHEVDRLASRFDSFMEELSNVLQRQAARS